MSSRLARPTGCFWEQPNADFPFRSLILYDEAESGRRAMRTLRSVTRKLDGSRDLDVCLWRLDMLADPALRAAANLDARDASMLVVSVRHAHRVPHTDHSVLATFFREARRSTAMVVALVNDPQIHPAALSHSLAGLRQVTRRAELEFLGCTTGPMTDQEESRPARDSRDELLIQGTFPVPLSSPAPGGPENGRTPGEGDVYEELRPPTSDTDGGHEAKTQPRELPASRGPHITVHEGADPTRQPAPESRGSRRHEPPLNFRSHPFSRETPGRPFQARVLSTANLYQ